MYLVGCIVRGDWMCSWVWYNVCIWWDAVCGVVGYGMCVFDGMQCVVRLDMVCIWWDALCGV